jgi:hypothetical protein
MDPVIEVLSALRARDCTWMKRRRKLDTATLFAILAQKRGNRASISESLYSMQLHDRANVDRDVMLRATPAAVSRALAKLPINTFKCVHEELVQHFAVQSLLARPRTNAPLYISVDGCHMRIPPALSHLRLGCQPTNTPHLLLTCAVDTRTDTILTYDISYQPDERAALLRLLHSGKIPHGSCVIADRGYFSADVWRELNALEMFAVFRVKRSANTEIESALGRTRRLSSIVTGDVPSRIATWSQQWDELLTAGLPDTPLQRCTAHSLWISPQLHYAPVPDDWFLLTNTRLTPHALVQLYLSRWRIETVHKTLPSSPEAWGLASIGGARPSSGTPSKLRVWSTSSSACRSCRPRTLLAMQKMGTYTRHGPQHPLSHTIDSSLSAWCSVSHPSPHCRGSSTTTTTTTSDVQCRWPMLRSMPCGEWGCISSLSACTCDMSSLFRLEQ